VRGQEHPIAGDLSREKTVEGEKADDVSTSGNDTQRDQQRSDRARISERWRHRQWAIA
jgi:hypothetical protein